MKYVNSLKTMSGFDSAVKAGDISQKRARELCEKMGRVHMGTRCICLPKGSAGYACAMMLEAVIKSAGHRVGRLTSAADFDARASIFVNGALPGIADFNTAVAELRAAVHKMSEPCLKEEATFALSMLLFKLCDCDYVILQGLSDQNFALDAICAPFELIVMPTVYDESEQGVARLKAACDSVRRGTREVVSGNQKSEIYNQISNACAMSGIRLYIPVKAQYHVDEMTAKRLRFGYCDKNDYCLRSPSEILQNGAMTVIESALALRRGGVKLPWSSIATGLESVTGTGAFDLISMMPLTVADIASNRREAEMLLATVCALWGSDKKLTLCVRPEDSHADELLAVFAEQNVKRVLLVGSSSEIYPDAARYELVKDAVAELLTSSDGDELILCFGGVNFASEIRAEIMKQMNVV